MAGRRFLSLLLTIAAALSLPPVAVEAARVVTTGKAKPVIQRRVPVAPDSTGATCVRASAGGRVNLIQVPMNLGKCGIRVGKRTATGKGRTRQKFGEIPPTGILVPRSDEALAHSFSRIGPMPITSADARASWRSFVDPNGVRATLKAEAEVRKIGARPPGGLAAAVARDPLVFDDSTSGSLDFDFFLGDTEIVLDPDTGEALSELFLSSDDPAGTGHLEFLAGFTGVSFRGRPLDGELFLLTIEADGPILSVADLDIGFDPWEGLGLSDSDVHAVIDHVESHLNFLSGGRVGLSPGEQLALIGPGSPIPTLTFDHGPGRASAFFSTEATAASPTPDPPTALLALLGLAVILRRGPRSPAVNPTGPLAASDDRVEPGDADRTQASGA